jgi:antitoxin HicB
MKKTDIGSSFDSWLREESLYEEVTAGAIKRTLARRIRTSRAALERLLDPGYDAVTLITLRKAANAVGRELRVELLRTLEFLSPCHRYNHTTRLYGERRFYRS